jgi:spore coat polysaccharide biosynthesis protein SpsF
VTVAAVIQARMGSSRLPGKVLLPLAGRPVLWHVVHRLRKCRTVDVIAVATSTAPADDALAAFAAAEGIACVRGPEDDVLARYLLAAEALAADVVVRVTGDAPLVDPAMLDALVGALLREGAEWANVRPGEPCIHEGFDPVTVAALRRLAAKAGGDAAAREHVTGYFRQHPGFARTAWVPVEPECRYSGARLSVDTPADLRFLEEVYRRLGVPPGEADVRAVARELRADPALAAINAHVHQKLAYERSRGALLRCDGDGRLGMGHVTRCLAIAAELRDAHAWGVSFAVAAGGEAEDAIRRAGFPVERSVGGDEAAWLDALVAARRPDALVLDVRTGLARGAVARWRASGIVTAVVDDTSERRLAADLAFFPPVPQVQRLDWSGFTGRRLAGWEWVPLRRSFAEPLSRAAAAPPRVLVAMGGSDPAGLTARAVAALDLLPAPLDVDVLVGAAFGGESDLADRIAAARHRFRIHRDVADPAPLMRGAAVAVASLGVTAYELAACGVPAVLLSLTDDHAESASAFAAAGIAISLGVHTGIADSAIADGLAALLADGARRAVMASRARALVDGRGAARIAAEIAAEAARR